MSNSVILTEVAVQDAASQIIGSIDLENIGEAEARKIMSVEHKALGYRPPPGSLASEAQAAAAKHPHPPNPQLQLDAEILKKAALEDAAKIERTRGNSNASDVSLGKSMVVDGVDLSVIGEADARKLMSEEHKALGYRPPPGSLAADAQSAAAKHPEGKANIDPQILAQAAIKDAARISSERRSGSHSPPKVDLENVTVDEAKKLQALENKLLESTKGTISAQAQSVVDKRGNEESTTETTA
ncbi:hypothetical protein E1B28_013592 [Marasmius oreades]|uniref:SMP domain-containing protein n=1 Tax=Marasmius oreades TaxID=181124 RepID=A0A9P7RPU6_9AGAR|nr:uncharacterized protein E1B28_013592 [Marasmius oreades]KAG7087644.1 hypothetical protein E1B28_013592 [Marasmius oreades]